MHTTCATQCRKHYTHNILVGLLVNKLEQLHTSVGSWKFLCCEQVLICICDFCLWCTGRESVGSRTHHCNTGASKYNKISHIILYLQWVHCMWVIQRVETDCWLHSYMNTIILHHYRPTQSLWRLGHSPHHRHSTALCCCVQRGFTVRPQGHSQTNIPFCIMVQGHTRTRWMQLR
jgi:hypothetical protein